MSTKLSFTIDGLDAHYKRVKTTKAAVQRVVQQAIEAQVREVLVPVVQRNTPVVTGALRESLHAEPTERGAKIVSTMPYAFEVHENTQVSLATQARREITPEGGQGPKFITRSVNAHAQEFKDRVGEDIQQRLKDAAYGRQT